MDHQAYTKDEMLMLVAINAPMPSENHIETQMQMDMNRNPHNETFKAERRSREMIIADYKIDYALMMYMRVDATLRKLR